jgi:hypothetical protein
MKKATDARHIEQEGASQGLSRVHALHGASIRREEAAAAWGGMKNLVPDGYARSSEDGLHHAPSTAWWQPLLTFIHLSDRRVPLQQQGA